MSFSKARIQRFNELTSEAPPPGAYEPKFDKKVKATVVQRTSRFNDAKSTSSGAESTATLSSRGTNNGSIKQFRTPQVPKKRVILKRAGMSCPRVKTKLYNNESKENSVQYKPEDELNDLRIECTNKSKTIEEYEKQMEDIKACNRVLNEKYEDLLQKYSQDEEQHQKDIESMAKLQQEVMDNKYEKYQSELQSFQSQLSFALKDYQDEISKRIKNEEDLRATVKSLEDQLNKHNDEDKMVDQMAKLEVDTNKLNEMNEDLNKELHLKDIKIADLTRLQLETENKLQDIQNKLKQSESKTDELTACLEKITNDNNIHSSTINEQVIGEMTNVLQEYFDYENYDGKWSFENKCFHPEIEIFFKKIRKFITDLKLTYEREIELSRDNFNEERENLEQDLEIKKGLISDLENKLSEANETNTFLTEELQDVQKLYKDINSSMRETKIELDKTNEKYTKALAAHKIELELTTKIHAEEQAKLKELLEEAQCEYLKELDNMTTARNEELTEVKEAMEKRIEDEKKRMKENSSKIVENAEAVTRETLKACRAESEERVRRIITETDAKISLLVREAKNSFEEDLRQATEKYNTCLDRLETEKSKLNSKLSEKDLEVIQLTSTLEEMKCAAETQESFSQSLQAELDRAEAELVGKKEELRNLKDQIRMESAEMVARRRRLDVVMAENQASVAALTRRLAQSEIEVERLQLELQTKEGTLTGYREMLESVTHNSKIVQEQLNSIQDRIDEKLELINKMEIKNVTDINSVKVALNQKIELLKSITMEELAKSQKECQEKTEQNSELKENLCLVSDRLSEATVMLLKLEELNDDQSLEISKLQLLNIKLQQQLEDKNNIANENDRILLEKEKQKHKTEVDELNEKILKLKEEILVLEKKQNEVQETKYDFEELELRYNDQLASLTANLESERDYREKLEQKLKQYDQTCEKLTSECKEITDKYIEVIGQNNHKQKIKYLSQLKENINVQQSDLLQLRQELESKNNIIDELRQTNEKLKVEERRQFGLGKENVHVVSSPHKLLFTKSANTTPISSPHKLPTPLRDRND